MDMNKLIKNSILSVIILFLCTLMSYVFVEMSIRIENIIMIYLIGVLFIVIETKSFFWGISASGLSIITFNYFFTMPRFSLEIYDPNYIITIVIFLIVSFITGSLVNKMQQHARISKYNEKQTLALYEISTNYLNISGIDNIILHNIKSLYEFQSIVSVVYYYNTTTNKLSLFKIDDILKNEMSDEGLARWCYDNRSECGAGTSFYEQNNWTYRPLHRNNEILGVYALLNTQPLNEEKEMFVNTLVSQMVLAIERELLYVAQEQSRIEIEKEKLRNNLLRSISHDLRTPLTSIAGSSSLIVENYHSLDSDTIYNLVKNISSDSIWLNQLVENLLNMTRIQDGKLLIKKQKEVVDDIICEASSRCESRKGFHTIQVHLPEEVVLVEMDGRLIIQVLINFIDNAIKHTQDDSMIDIYCHIDKQVACFEVIDNGAGINQDISDKLFESFITTKSDRSDSKRGVGLGLSICKAIVEAHHGTIYAHNRADTHGAVFGFKLPINKENNNE
ncbi:MAG: DUF4118 domain-containing protein [Longicatena sp.]